MNKINRIFSAASSFAGSRTFHIAILVFALALFVFSAGAPNATIGIGK